MKLGIRGKLVLLLTVVALLPLMAALVTITVAGRRMRTESFGYAIQTAVVADAQTLRISLLKDIEKLRLVLQHEVDVGVELSQHNTKLPAGKLSEMDAVWAHGPSTADEARIMQEVEHNVIAAKLGRIRQGDPRIAEILVTDRFGQLVAATGRTSDFDQADEDWWQEAYNQGHGRIVVPPISYDQSSGVWSVDVCIPIFEGERLVGVAKTVFSLLAWMSGVSRKVGEMPVTAMLVGRDGAILYRDSPLGRNRVRPAPKGAVLSDWGGAIAEGQRAGWRITKDGYFQAFSPVWAGNQVSGMPAKFPYWSLVLSLPASEPMAVIRQLSFTVLGIGLAIIAGIFLAGLLLVERSITRRIRRLEYATRAIAEGELSHRIEAGWAGARLLGADEIDQLAEDFNRMVRRVEESHRTLQEANELKTNFIQIAGHELRTPVSYILGMTRLLGGCLDPDRLAKGVQSMGAKARRLDEIIQAMFKLMPALRRSQTLDYRDVEIVKLLEEVYVDAGPFLEQRDQRMIIEPVTDLPIIRVDSDKLRDVLENLVMNAIKFTPDGGEVRVKVGRQLGQMVSIAVHDQGPGISNEDLPHIFEPFYSTADVMKHSTGTAGYQKRGIGLGLAIVRRFVELHHGTVHVSTGPQGSVFTVSIPVSPPPSDT